MRANRLRTLWRDGRAAVNGWLPSPSSFAAETMSHQGLDTLTVDMQQGVIDEPAFDDVDPKVVQAIDHILVHASTEPLRATVPARDKRR